LTRLRGISRPGAAARGPGSADVRQFPFGGQAEADLGEILFKKRVVRQGGGKSSGYRTVMGFRGDGKNRICFPHGFPKCKRSNIAWREQAALSVNAKALIDATDDQVTALKQKGTIVELECEA